jgi:hypothetical protein
MLQESIMTRPPAGFLTPPRRPRVAGLVVCICRECFQSFAKKRIDQTFCDTACRRAFHQRIESRKTELYNAAMAMRSKRKGAFSAMTNIADRFLREDARRERDYIAARCAQTFGHPRSASTICYRLKMLVSTEEHAA